MKGCVQLVATYDTIHCILMQLRRWWRRWRRRWWAWRARRVRHRLVALIRRVRRDAVSHIRMAVARLRNRRAFASRRCHNRRLRVDVEGTEANIALEPH